MTRFEELTGFAETWARGFHAMMDDLTFFARPLIMGLREYLGIPQGSRVMQCQQIDREGRNVDEPSFAPSLCYWFDMLAYFDLVITYPAPWPYEFWQIGRIRLGFKKVGDEYIVRNLHVDGVDYEDFHVKPDNLEETFYKPFFEMLRTGLQLSWTEDKKPPFGFQLPEKRTDSTSSEKYGMTT